MFKYLFMANIVIICYDMFNIRKISWLQANELKSSIYPIITSEQYVRYIGTVWPAGILADMKWGKHNERMEAAFAIGVQVAGISSIQKTD